ncbi:hypothetical protein ACU045_10900 [Microbacterium sp. MAHUQ-60]|uniref:hypothetical protein n=1 Tax=unclassified Microbacterium TaxID=2609290 RepID=UPI003606F963
MSTEEASTGSGAEPERDVIGFVPALGGAGDEAADGAAGGENPTDAPQVDHVPDATDHVAHPTDDDASIDSPEAGGDDARVDEEAIDDDAVFYEDQVEPEYGILGFTLRELVIVGAWALAFLVSFFPVLHGGASVWTSGIDWILTIGVPTAAVFLVVLRRFSPEGIRRVGSLGIDQFASVAAAVAAVTWTQVVWHQVTASIQSGALLLGWVPVVALVATLALVAATVVAPLIPGLREDFEGRMETLAHRNADPVRPVIRRPRPVPAPPVVDAEADDESQMVAATAETAVDPEPGNTPIAGADATEEAEGEADADATRVIEVVPDVEAPQPQAASVAGLPADPGPRQEGTAYTDPIGALHEIFESRGTPVPGDAEHPPGGQDPAGRDGSEQNRAGGEAEALLRRNRSEYVRDVQTEAQPFWILAATERDVLDERGQPLYRIGPNAWTLVIEDRDGAYVVRHDDGRIGYLHDLSDITKG